MSKTTLLKLLIFICIAAFVSIVLFSFHYSGYLLFRKSFQLKNASTAYEAALRKSTNRFYMQIKDERGNFSIIEYPSIIQDRYNPLYQYQSLHRKNILNGYFLSHDLKKEWRSRNILAFDVLPVEILLSRIENNKINFSKIINVSDRFINLYNIREIRDSGARYIILHKNIRKEIIALPDNMEMDILPVNSEIWLNTSKFALHFREYYIRYFGEPAYEDNVLVAFKISSGQKR